MDDKKNKVKLIREISESQFLYKLKEDELKELLEQENDLKEGITILKAYFSEDDENIFIGMYIINSSENDIEVIDLPIGIFDGEKVVFSTNLNINRAITKESVIFKEMVIVKEKITNISDGMRIGIVNRRKISKHPFVEIDIEGVPKVEGYRNYREIKNFLNNLTFIEKNKLCIDIFKSGQSNNGLTIILLLRNSTENNLNIKSLPIEVYTDKGIMIYKGVYISDSGIQVKAGEGRFYEVTIPWEKFITAQAATLHNFNVKFVE